MGSVYDKMKRCFADSSCLGKMALDDNWRVRYSAAVAMGETGQEEWLPLLEEMFLKEEKEPLYDQPNVDGNEATRLSEKIGPLADPFEGTSYTEEQREAWKRRGRLKAAIADAMGKIGKLTPSVQRCLENCIENEKEDYSVKAAAARALGRAGSRESLDALKKALQIDEWCTQTEAKKAIRKIEEGDGR